MGRVAPALARDTLPRKQGQALLERDAQRSVAQCKQFWLRLLRAEHCAHEPVDHCGPVTPEFILEPGDCGIARRGRRPLAHRAVHDHQRRQRRIAMPMQVLQRLERAERPGHQHDRGVAGDELMDVFGTALGVEPLGRTVGLALATRIESHDAMVRAQRLKLPAPDRGRRRPARHEGDGRLPRARLAGLDDVQAHAVGGGEMGAFKVHLRRVQRCDQGCKRCRKERCGNHITGRAWRSSAARGPGCAATRSRRHRPVRSAPDAARPARWSARRAHRGTGSRT